MSQIHPPNEDGDCVSDTTFFGTEFFQWAYKHFRDSEVNPAQLSEDDVDNLLDEIKRRLEFLADQD